MYLQKFLEFKQEDLEPVTSFRLRDSLDPKLWKDSKLDDSVRKKLLTIAKDFYENLEIDVEFEDIILTGSLANFNYSKYSDFDLHILVDFTKINDDIEIVKKWVDAVKTTWNKEHDIVLKGYDVELYVQDVKEKHNSSGVFSLLNNKWKIKPSKSKYEPDEKTIEEKGKTIMLLIDDLEKSIGKEEYKTYKNNLKKVWEKIKKIRQDGLDTKEKEFSTGNLVFKLLRRNGYIEKILKLKRLAYDKQFENFSDHHNVRYKR